MSLLAALCKVKAFEWKAETISAIKIDALQHIKCSRYQKKKKERKLPRMLELRLTELTDLYCLHRNLFNVIIYYLVSQMPVLFIEYGAIFPLSTVRITYDTTRCFALVSEPSLSLSVCLASPWDDDGWLYWGSCIVTICSGDFPLVM